MRVVGRKSHTARLPTASGQRRNSAWCSGHHWAAVPGICPGSGQQAAEQPLTSTAMAAHVRAADRPAMPKPDHTFSLTIFLKGG